MFINVKSLYLKNQFCNVKLVVQHLFLWLKQYGEQGARKDWKTGKKKRTYKSIIMKS